MKKRIVVGPDQKPTLDQLLEMYEKLDGQMKEIKGQMKRGVLSSRHIQALIEHRNPFEKKVVVENELLVNYDLSSIEALVKECGCDYNNDDITSKNFPTKRTGQCKVETKTYHFNKVMTSEEAIAEMKKDGFRPAETHELLAYGIKNRDEQRKYPIVGLGSVWQYWFGFRRVAYLYGYAGKRYLYLSFFGSGWYGGDRFLAVRES
mgnify:CR=1 FL=1